MDPILGTDRDNIPWIILRLHLILRSPHRQWLKETEVHLIRTPSHSILPIASDMRFTINNKDRPLIVTKQRSNHRARRWPTRLGRAGSCTIPLAIGLRFPRA